MELSEIDAFLAIHTHGSFTAAARALHITQPAISRRIDLLERDLGTPLFDRIPTGARLTDAGIAFAPFAIQAVAALADGQLAVRDLATGNAGSIRLAMVGTLASTPIRDRLVAFRRQHPGMKLEIRTARSDEVGDLVARGDSDLGLRYFADANPTLLSAQIGSEPLVVAASATSPLVGLHQVLPADLQDHPWIRFPLGRGSSGEPFAHLLDELLIRARVKHGDWIEIDSLTAQKRMIEADFGLGLIPRSSLDEELLAGTIAILNVPALTATIPIIALRRRNGYRSPALIQLLASLTESPNP